MNKPSPEYIVEFRWASNDDLDDILVRFIRGLESDGFSRPAIRDRLSALVAVYNSHEERNRYRRLLSRLKQVKRGGEQYVSNDTSSNDYPHAMWV